MLSPPELPPYVLLGRFGDVIQMLPCLMEIHRRTGMKPTLIISDQYASVLDGVSYVNPYSIHVNWWTDIPKARQIAQSVSQNAIVLQWWFDDPEHARMVTESAKGDFVIQCHGRGWGVDISKHPDYGTSMASRFGFTQEEWVRLPLVFDRRDTKREETLARQFLGVDKRPVLLMNFTGQSSPFGLVPEVMAAVRNAFGKVFRVVDLGPIHAFRIFDLLGLYDRAVGLITSDTSTMHLAPASKIPYIGFTVDSWSSSVPKGNCMLHLKYKQVRSKLQQVIDTVGIWASL
jgi:hypothetical protein